MAGHQLPTVSERPEPRAFPVAIERLNYQANAGAGGDEAAWGAQLSPSTVRIVLTTPFALFVGATQLARSLSSGWAFAIANE